jgi:hypothetical protein
MIFATEIRAHKGLSMFAFSTAGAIRTALVLACLTLLVACGGGGGGDASSGGSDSGNPSGGTSTGAPTGTPTSDAPALKASTNAVSAIAAPTDLTPAAQVNLSIVNPPGGGLYYQAAFTGTAVASASVIWSSPQAGSLELMLERPGFMGSGTYHDTVTLSVCTDSKCANPISGSPVSVAVTYTVTGNAVSDSTYAIVPNTLALEAASNSSAPTSTVNVTAYNVPPYGAYVFHTSQSGGPVGSMSFKQTSGNAEPYAYGTGTLTVNMKSPADLGPGVYNDVITLSICYDSACTKPAAGTPFQIPVTYTVTASAGREFQQQIVNQNLTALAIDPTGTFLYGATAPQTLTPVSATPSQLIKIDPASGAVTNLLTLPAAVGQIAVSKDGAYLYLLTQAWTSYQLTPPIQVVRVRASDMSIDQTVALTSDTGTPSQIAVSPLDSNTWSAAFSTLTGTLSVVVFDGPLARPNNWSAATSSDLGVGALWSTDGSALYIVDNDVNALNAVPVSASGLGSGTRVAALNGFAFNVGIQLAGGLFYSDGGGALDPTTSTILGHYSLPAGVPYAMLTIDTTNDRVFAAYEASLPNSVVGTIESFGRTDFTAKWLARLPIGTQPLRWGTRGLAWIGPGSTMGQNALYLINGTFVAP